MLNRKIFCKSGPWPICERTLKQFVVSYRTRLTTLGDRAFPAAASRAVMERPSANDQRFTTAADVPPTTYNVAVSIHTSLT